MSDGVDDRRARNAAKYAAKAIKETKETNKVHANLYLDRDNYRKLQKKLGRGSLSSAVDLVIRYLLEELDRD